VLNSKKNILEILGLTVLVALSAIGGASILYRLWAGLKVTALTSYVTWGIWVAAYIFFIGLSAGSFVVSALHSVFGKKEFHSLVRPALLSALFCLFGGMVFIGLDIGHPFRFWYMFVYPSWTSIMTIEAWLYVLYMGIIFSELVLWLRPKTDAVVRSMKMLGILGLVVALGVHWGTGAIFAINIARPLWHGGLQPVIFLVSALVSGLGLMIFMHEFFGPQDENHEKVLRSLTTYLLVVVAIDLIFLSGEVLTKYLYQGSSTDIKVWNTILFGPYWWVFWVGQIGLATLAPLVLGTIGLKHHNNALLGFVGLATVLGIFAVRMNIVIPAFTVPELAGLETAFQGKRLAFTYFPSTNEIWVTVGLIAMLILGFILTGKFLDFLADRLALAGGPKGQPVATKEWDAGSMLSRRRFLKFTTSLGFGSALGLSPLLYFGNKAWAKVDPATPAVGRTNAENILYTTCLNCHVRCPLKASIQDGVLVKLDGSPFAAKTFLPNIPFDTAVAEAARVEGRICPKGQSAHQIYYDPYRLKNVLKRKGLRGGNEWERIPFDQAIDEIVQGGNLFDEGNVEGLKEIFALRDPELAQSISEDIEKLRAREITVEQFQSLHKEHLGIFADPDHPDLGPKNNQFCFMAGRIQHGRKELAQRWVHDGLGSINFMEHTTICEQSHHIATERMTWDAKNKKGKHHFKPDFLNAEFVIFWGTGAFEANFGSTALSEMVTRATQEGKLKYAVIDPRLSNTAAKAWKWIPVKPGYDLALALGMMRWIIDNERFDKPYLENANNASADKDGEPTFTDATHLVRLDTLKFLRPEEIKLPEGEHVVMTPQGPKSNDAIDHGMLEVDTTLNGIQVKSVFTLLRERAQEKSLTEYAELAGLEVSLIEELAKEFTSHGKKASIDTYRGLVQHTGGYYNQQAVLSLNLLIGNMDWKGGLTDGGGHWHEAGEKKNQPYNLKKSLHPGKLRKLGVPISRENSHYEASTLFHKDGFPAKRPWYPFTGNIYQEIIPSAEAGYPYPLKALWIHKGTPGLSSPGAGETLRILKDPSIIPLVFVDDVVLGDTSVFADYVFPDLTFLERWGMPHDNPQPSVKTSAIRQPIVEPMTEEVEIDGERMPISMEAMMLAISSRLGMSGFGKDGFGPGMDFKRPEDYFLKMVSNIAVEGEPLPDADPEEIRIFRKARRHLPASVFDEEKWKRAAGPDFWKKVIYVLNRGGRFENFDKAYEGVYMSHRYGKQLRLYIDEVATTRNSVTGKNFDGLAKLEPVLHSDGTPVEDSDKDFPYTLITYKMITGGQSRTIPQYSNMLSIQPENFILINIEDARKQGLQNRDRVRVQSITNQEGTWPLSPFQGDRHTEGFVKITEGIRPGVIAISYHYGHWAYGAQDSKIDGETIKGDPSRSGGLCPNAVMRLDRYNTATGLTDPIGGSASFNDTKVRLINIKNLEQQLV